MEEETFLKFYFKFANYKQLFKGPWGNRIIKLIKVGCLKRAAPEQSFPQHKVKQDKDLEVCNTLEFPLCQGRLNYSSVALCLCLPCPHFPQTCCPANAISC